MKSRLQVVPLIAIATLGFLAASCKEESVEPTASNPGTIVPLKVGNQWVYNIAELDYTGRVISESHDTLSIVNSTTIGTETWFEDNAGILQTNRADGRWLMSGSPYLTEKYPAKLNDAYVVMDSLTGISARVRGVSETVVVPKGTFSSYIYRWTRISDGDPVADFWYVPNVGLVQSETYTRSARGLYVSSRKTLLARTTN